MEGNATKKEEDMIEVTNGCWLSKTDFFSQDVRSMLFTFVTHRVAKMFVDFIHFSPEL